MNVKRLFLIAFLSAVSHSLFAQTEICNNGVDDDFDGFIDCYDGSCANSPQCDGIFLGNDATCTSPPPVFPQFTMTLDFSSPNQTTNHLARMAVGDLDRDGIPEIISMNRYTRTLYILNGNNGSVKRSVVVPWEPYWEIAIANLDNDSCAEIFLIGYDTNGTDGVYMYGYDCNLNQVWRTAQPFLADPVNFGVADFDGDGLSEIYAKDEIFDAKTGIRIVKSSATTTTNYNRLNGGPVAVNMGTALAAANNTNLELVLGLRVFQVNLGTRAADAGSLTLLQQRTEYFIRNPFNATSVADFNQDGFLDVLASGSTGSHGSNTTVFFWDVKNNQLRTFRDGNTSISATLPPPLNTTTVYPASDYGSNGWGQGTGRLNVADLDGDGKMNVSYVSGKYLYALKEDFSLLWRKVINEETSGYTGCTLFDFNGDGRAEIVYRDERFLYIIQGRDGSIYSQQACISRTNREYPIVADVDADGSTELCVTCGFNDTRAAANFNTLDSSRYSHVRVFKSAAEPWVPARRVWNQHGYFVVNVNDDLTIPRIIQPHQTVFSTGSCTQGPNRPLNKFLNQSPYLNSEGCPTYAAPDIAFSVAPTVVPPTCPDLNFQVSFAITNLGDLEVTGNIPVTFYTTNPKRAGSVKLNTITLSVNKLSQGDVVTVSGATVTGIGSDSLYVVLNDAGTSVPTPIVLPNTTFFECNYDNIRGVRVRPRPVQITALKVNDAENCSSAPTGVARAYIPISGGGENTADYNFYWSNGAVAKPIASADFVGAIYSGLSAGTYTVYARHKTANCNSDTTQVTISSLVSIVPDVTVNVVANQTSCTPNNGRLEAVIAGGGAGYTIDWYDIALNPLGITGPTANNLPAGSYLVIISKGTCTKSSAPVSITGPSFANAVGQVTKNVQDCSNPNSGEITAQALVSGVPQNPGNYTFDWYNYNTVTLTQGSILPPFHGTGPTRTGLPVGSYQVVIRDNATGCLSTSLPVSITSSTVIPNVQITQVAPQTSCDPANPNGILRADVYIGGVLQNPADFTFQWFKGQNTLPANLVATTTGTNGQIVNKVAGGGIPYTVKITTAFNCTATNDFTIAESLINPVVTLTAAPNGVCNPSLASGAYTGSVTATVTFNGSPVTDFTNYSFGWHKGNLATDPAPTPNSTTNVLSQQNGGQYTLVVNRTDLGCASAPVTATINNVATQPTLTTNDTGSTNCVAGLENGSAEVVTVDGSAVGTVTNYSYQWHSGINTATPILIGANATAQSAKLNNVQGGVSNNYTVLVTNTTSGCQSTATVLVPDLKVLPLVTLSKTDNTICSPATSFDGTVTASVTNIPGGNTIANYTFVFGGGQNTGVTTGNVYSVLNGGPTPYTAVATHTPTGCQSSQVTIVVNNNQNIPDLVTGTTGSTNCTAGLENGRARVVTVDGAAASTVGFTYSWVGPTTPAFPVTGNTTNDDIELQNVQGGTGYDYTVSVTNIATGCVGSAVVNIPDNKSLPVLTLTPQPNTICDPSKVSIGTAAFDGQVGATVNAIGNYAGSVATDFNFVWSGGTTPPSGIGVVTYAGLDVGTYSVVATHTSTGCQSNSFSANVTSAKTLPNITMGQIPSQNCTGGAPDGTAQVTNVLPNGRNYEYRWFEGNSTSGTPGPVTANTVATTSSFTNVRGGINGASLFEYTVQVTILQTGCINTATVGVSSDSQLPIVALAAPVNNTNCSPTKNGSAALSTLTYRGNPIGAPYAGFTFDWSGSGTVGPSPGNTYTQLAAGNYTLTVTNTDDNCVSNPVPVTIADNLYIPVINVADVDQTSCNPATPNGSLTATVNDLAVGGTAASTAGYSFAWVDNVDASHTGNASLFSGLKGNQNYTVTVTRTLTGCTNSQTAFVDEAVILPTITVTPSPLTFCSTPNGQVNIATVTPGVIGDYEFFWYDGSDAVDAASIIASPDFSTGSSYTGLIPGQYTVVARNTSTRCVSAPVISTVAYSGPIINPVVENTVVPAICNALGSMTGGVRTSNTTTFAGAVNDELTLTANIGLAVGNRVIIKRNGVLPLPAGVEENKTYYVKSVVGLVIILEDAPAGTQIDLTTIGNGTISNYVSPGAGLTYEWFDGVPTGTTPADPINLFSNPPNFGALVTSGTVAGPVYSGIPDGLYTLKVTDNATGCFNYIAHTLPFIGSHAVIRISKTNSTVCPPNPDDGSITIQIEDPATAPGGATYNISVTGPMAVPAVAGAVELSNYTLSTTLIPGTYVVTVRQNYGSNCELDQDVIIGRDAFDPVVTLASAITPNNACDNTQFNGSIQINIAANPDDLVPGQDYDIDMTIDPNNAFPLNNQAAGTYAANNLGPNTYQFTVTSSTGCSVAKSFTVLNNPVLSQILNANVNAFDAEYCTPALEQSARALVTQINLVSGATDDLDDYRFNWYSSGSLFTASSATDKVTFAGHGFANNDRVLLIIDGTFPAGLSPNAEYFVKAATANDFELSLTAGGSTVDITANGTLRIARNQLSALGNSTVTKGGEEFSNTLAPLPASPVTIGTYYVTATKITDTNAVGGIGCASAPLTVTIGDKTIKPTIALTPTGDTACSTTVFEGSIEVDMSTASGPGSVVGATYSYAWAPNGGAGQPVNSAGNNGINNIFGNLNDGSYTLTATNQLTGCQNSLATTIIRATPPIFTLTADAVNLTTCNLGAFNGEINNLQVFVNGAGGNEPDFDYVWFRSDLLPASKIIDGQNVAVLVDDELTLTTYPAIALDKYFVKAIRKAGGAGVGCESAALRKDILDDRVYPQISFTTTPNTSCNNEFDGSITVTATTSGFAAGTTNYNFDWTSNPGGAVVITDAIGVLSNPSRVFQSQALGGPVGERIGPGAYGITVTNTVNQCPTTGTVSVQQNTVPVTITGTSSTPLTHCTVPNGATQVTTVDVGTTTGVVLGNFVFTWTGPGGPHPNGTNLAPLSSGDYFVTAQKTAITTPASGCSSTPVKVTVLDQRQFPVLSFNTTASTACDTNYDGQISVTATTAGFVGPNYNFDWTSNPVGTTITDRVGASPYTYQAGDVIGQGSYSITVTNQSNMCAISGNVAVLQNSPSIEILTTTKTDQLICNPDGSITVTSLSLGTPANYTFNWFRNTATSTALVDGASATIITPLLDRNNYPTMGADTFFVRGTRNPGSSPGSGCVTAPYRVDVLDKHVDPRIQFNSIIANSTCDVTLANGGVLANASEQNGTNTDTYSFSWQRNGGVLPVITNVSNTSNSSQLSSALDGNYTLTITNTTGTGCSTSATVDLLLDQSRSTPNIIDVSTIDPLDCNPTGSATVLKITLGSTTNSLLFPPNVPPNNEVTGAGLLSYNYEWYSTSVNASNQLPLTGPPFTTTPNINSLLRGTYFVLVRDPSTNCISGPKEVVIEDDNIVYPDLNVTQTVKQLSCITTTGTAALAATADGQTDTNANYQFTWFNNLTNTAPVFASTSTISNLLTGNYSITVLNLTTNCTAQASYIVQDESALFTPIVSMGGQPRTLCVGTDGSVLARVSNANATYPFGYNASTFTADLFNGTLTNPSGTPAVSGMPRVTGFFTSFVQTGLNEGFYTVRIRDNNTGCVGIGNHEIKDERIYPKVDLEKIAPMTNCDPARPNGVARVSVNGGFSGFQFDWYAGTTASGTPLFVGPQFDQLRAAPQQYVIRATNLVSGCISDLPANFVNGTVPIPTPTIEKLSDVTSCVISNGALTVYVGTDKNTKDYIFNWYDGTAETPPADFIGETYTDLAAGNYSVTATSVITGCKSPLTIGEVLQDQDFPEFDFLVQSTSCDKNDGYATLIMTSDVPIERIEWSNSNGPFLNGPNFTEAMAGIYTVTATSFFGCSTTKDVEIKPDIRPFNGISRNGDGQNDFFKINCIQNFPENLVKIFNRAGTLVYEAVGYDNATIYFDGKSNKGISPMGVNLPDGTYFYIVDKRDGSKPLAGYLEIVN